VTHWNCAGFSKLWTLIPKSERLSGIWQRFHLAQDLIHDRGMPVSANLAANVAAQLADEPAHTSSPASGWQQTFAKFAIAASVAAVFVIGMQANLQQSPAPAEVADNPASNVEPNSAGMPLQSPEATLLAEGTALAVDPAAADRLRNYLEGIAIDVSEPVVTQHIQDSPLYRLVNQVQD